MSKQVEEKTTYIATLKMKREEGYTLQDLGARHHATYINEYEFVKVLTAETMLDLVKGVNNYLWHCDENVSCEHVEIKPRKVRVTTEVIE